MDVKELYEFMKSSEERRQLDWQEGMKKMEKMMKEMVKPFEKRTTELEENMASVQDEVKKLTLEVKELKERETKKTEEKAIGERELKEKDDKEPTLSWAKVAGRGAQGVKEARRRSGVQPSDEQEEKVRIAFAAAKLTVGLRPITKEVVKEHKMKRDEYGVNDGKSEEEKETDAREAACREFFKKEMKMTDDDIDSMSVERIFAPNKDDWDTLYVRLENEDDVGFLMSFKHYMRKGVQPSEKAEVINYIPRILFNRYKAITKIGNDERHKNGKNINFRVTFGETDFRLQFKNRGSRYWDTPVALPEDLPGVEYQLPRGDRAPDHAILIRKIRRERGLPLPLLPASLHQLKGTHQKNLKNLLCLKMTSSERTSIRKPLSSHPNDRHNYPQGQNWHLQCFQTPKSKTEK